MNAIDPKRTVAAYRRGRKNTGQNTVEPIRDREIIAAMKREFIGYSIRDHGLFTLGINSALRISDLIKLTVGDMRKPELYIRMTKTGKEIFLPISSQLLRELRPLMDGKEDHEYLFMSRQKKKIENIRKHIDRSVAYRLLRRVGKKYGLEHIGTHSLRKTFAYHHYKEHKNLAVLMDLLGHTDEYVTLRYIGISQDDIRKTMRGFHL